ncbi:hypothetical protein CY35_19G081600 [Sphagnum magellanicum]|nr:hypothetical protein CY35_19G081600 [Sphagnum magellanicum]
MESTRRAVVSDHPQARRSLYWVVFIATVCIQLLMLIFVGSCEGRELKQAAGGSFEKEIRLEAYTDNSTTNTPMHGPAVKSFQVSDGSWVDCVPIQQQIAAHHPALKDHIIRMETSASSRLNLPKSRRESELHPQCFGREYGGCPEGSIPVQRMSTDPNNPRQKKHWRKLQSPRTHTKHSNTTDPADPNAELPHQYAVVNGAPTSIGAYTGGGAIFSVNGPVIADPSSEFSLSQLWIVAGDASNLNTAEVGWQVYPSAHPSDYPLAPHLFVYWTSDDYQATGCYNLDCSGFVQTDNTWVLGGAFSQYTTLAENSNIEYEVAIYVAFDPQIPGWELFIENTGVGYWPSSIYNTLQTSADSVQFGGEIAPATIPTGTAMGSGAFPSQGYPSAAYQRNVFYFDSAGNSIDANITILEVSNPYCYTLLIEEEAPSNDWSSFFIFGGPGALNSSCVS